MSNSIGWIPRSTVAGSYGKEYALFWKKAPSCLSEWLCHSAFPPAQCQSSCCSTCSPSFSVVIVLNFCLSNRCVVIPHCFNLQLTNGIWYWVSSHMLIYNMYVYTLWWGIFSYMLSILFFFILTEEMPTGFGERGREGEKHPCDRETLTSCLLYMPAGT